MTITQKTDRLEGLAIRMASTRQEIKQANLPHAVYCARVEQLQEDEAEHSSLWQELSAPVKRVKVRCPHYQAIKRSMAIAREHGLNVKEEDRMRGAFSAWLGRRVESRSELNGAEWMNLGDAIKVHRLTW